MTFQKTVISVAIIILMLSLGLISYMLWNAQGSTKYPPEISMCPDFWEATQQQKASGIDNPNPKMICRPNPNLGDDANKGTFSGKEFDFSSPKFQGPSGLSAKCKWASTYDVFWDGVSTLAPSCKQS